MSLPLGFRTTDLWVIFVSLRPCTSKAAPRIVFKIKWRLSGEALYFLAVPHQLVGEEVVSLTLRFLWPPCWLLDLAALLSVPTHTRFWWTPPEYFWGLPSVALINIVFWKLEVPWSLCRVFHFTSSLQRLIGSSSNLPDLHWIPAPFEQLCSFVGEATGQCPPPVDPKLGCG